MKLIDIEKVSSYRGNDPLTFWVCSMLVASILLFLWVIFAMSVWSEELTLLIKGMPTVSKHEHPFGFYLVMIFDLLLLSPFTYTLYLAVFKTKP